MPATHILRNRLPAAAAALAVLVTASAADAHAHLMTSSPAANSSVSAPGDIKLQFSEAPLAKFCGAQLQTASGTSVPVSTKAAHNNTLVIVPKSSLGSGTYTVKWHVVTADTHRTQGAFAFTVR